MYSFDKALAWISFFLISICITISPWLFGAWEAWHFWPMASLIFLSTLTFSFRLFLKAYRAEMFKRTSWKESTVAGKWTRLAFATYFVFIIYAFFRFMTSQVYADAERSFLLFLTPGLIAAQIVFSFTTRQNRALFWMITINLIFLGIYGIINHIFFNNEYTMWIPGEPTYQIGVYRATGSYVCPNHYAGIMEFALGIGLAMILARGMNPLLRISGTAISVMGLAAVFFSKSRGGGFAVMAMMAVCLLVCLFDWPRKQRWLLRTLLAGFAIIALSALILIENPYMTRLTTYFGLHDSQQKPAAERIEHIKTRLSHTARWKMFSAAYRAWQTAPAFGIGAGMHQNLWPHYAASPDGRRDTADWPTQINDAWYSYEVHSDWLQLLQEYGIVGLTLFLIPLLCTCIAFAALRKELSSRENPSPFRTITLNSAILALAAMTLHSLGDFNLQMPATTWMLAILITIPLQHTAYSNSNAEQTEEDLELDP